MEKFKSVAVAISILLSLLPLYMLIRFLQSVILPRQSPGRLIAYIFIVFLLVILYTFLVSLLVRLVFRVA